jgi:DNA ligase-4
MEYDSDKIFTHLVFYIDNLANAEANGLESSSPTKESQRR